MHNQQETPNDSDWHGLREVVALSFPANELHDTYQEYYRTAMGAALHERDLQLKENSGTLFPDTVRGLRRIRDSYRLNHSAAGRLAAGTAAAAIWLQTGRGRAVEYPAVGEYLFRFRGGAELQVAIDSYDSGEIMRPDLLARSDVYFKTNYRIDMSYPSKVHPLPNANPVVLRNIGRARGLRSVKPEYDLFAFFRVCGGADELEGIEHDVALFEILAGVHCEKDLTAYLVCGDVAEISRRLERVGVDWRTDPMPLMELWARGARARLHVVRHGMHGCVPWRMTDVLATGGCPVLDFPMATRWPHPLEERRNYLQLNAQGSSDSGPRQAADSIGSWLREPGLIAGIRANNAAYFESCLAPLPLGNYICSVVASYL